MPSQKTKEIIGQILNKPSEVTTKNKRGRKPKKKESTSTGDDNTNDAQVGEKSPEKRYSLRQRKRND